MARVSKSRRERAAKIGAILDELLPMPAIPLDHGDPFELLVAVLLSAQTTDRAVNLVTPALFARAPTPAAMAAMSVEEILAIIRTIGLAPTKAKQRAVTTSKGAPAAMQVPSASQTRLPSPYALDGRIVSGAVIRVSGMRPPDRTGP